MPNLPTLTLTQAQFDRCVAAFGDAAAYRAWLTENLRTAIFNAEMGDVLGRQSAERNALEADISTNVLP